MPTDIRDLLDRTTPVARSKMDVVELARRARRRRRGRTVLAASGSVALALGLVAGGILMRSPQSETPVVGSASTAASDDPTTVASSWLQARAGSLHVSATRWEDPAFEPLLPTRQGEWAATTQAVVERAASSPVDGKPFIHLTPSVGPDGQVLFVAPSTGDDPLVLVDRDGGQHVVDLAADRVLGTWVPADGGSWLILATDSDGATTVHQLAEDGAELSASPLPDYDPDWGGVPATRDDEIWVWSGLDRFRVDESEPGGAESREDGPLPADEAGAWLLSTDGGQTLSTEYDWQPLDETPVADVVEGPFEVPEDDHANVSHYRVSTNQGAVNVEVERSEDAGDHVDLLVPLHGAGRTHGHSSQDLAGGSSSHITTVLVATPDTVWATGFRNLPTNRGVSKDPDGHPYLITIDEEGYSLTDVTPPAT